MVKPNIHDVIPLVRELYSKPHGAAGCCCHIVLDDLNVEDCFVKSCLENVGAYTECQDPELCRQILTLLSAMSKTQRKKVARCSR